MERQIYWVHFKENWDADAVDEICWDFAEATPYFDENEVRFYGTAERLEEFKRAIATVETIDHII